MRNFVMLWSKTLDSSIWRLGSKEERIMWLTMLMMKDSEGKVFASVVGLADRARVSVDECKAALKKFLNPDKNDTSGVEDGRKIREIQGGWEIVNHEIYRFSTEAKRELWRQQKAQQRADADKKGKQNQTRKKTGGSARERASVEAFGAGDDSGAQKLSEPRL